jgi:hypothetical protein
MTRCGGSPATYSSLPSASPACRTQNLSSGALRIGDLYRGTSALEKFVHRTGGVLAHFLEDVDVAPEGHRGVGVALSPICALMFATPLG